MNESISRADLKGLFRWFQTLKAPGSFLARNLLVFGLALLPGFLLGMQQEKNPNLNHYSLRQGLSQVTISSIVQDRQGFMWFGTWDGLNRFDGYDFEVFKNHSEGPSSLSDNFIKALLEGKDGVLWVGLKNGGLDALDPNRSSIRHFPLIEDGNAPEVKALAEDHQGTLWIGTASGLFKMPHGGDAPEFIENKAISAKRILSLAVTQKGDLLIGCLEGLYVHVPSSGETRLMMLPEGQPGHHPILALEVSRTGVIYAGTARGLCRVNQDDGSFELLRPGDGKTAVASIIEDGQGVIWVVIGGKVYTLEPGAEALSLAPIRLPEDYSFKLYQDRSGLFWFGSVSQGLFSWDPATTRFRSKQIEIPRTLLELEPGKLLVGSSVTGLYLYESQTSQLEPHPLSQSLASREIYCLARDSENTLWVGSRMGLHLLPQGADKFKLYEDPSLAANTIGNLYLDQARTLWVNAQGAGLYALNIFEKSSRMIPVGTSEVHGIEGLNISTLFEDSQSRLWVGTEDAGFSLSDPEKTIFQHFRKKMGDAHSLSHNAVLHVFEDERGRFWLGTRGGLNLFDPNTRQFTHLREKDGLPNDTVYGILPDSSGDLWLSTNGGLSKFAPDTRQFTNYDIHDGLPDNEFNHGPILAGSDGRMYFGGVHSIVSFKPEEIVPSNFKPPVVFTDFLLSHRRLAPNTPQSPLSMPVNATEILELDHDQSAFSFYFSALDYAQPSQNKYAYKLEGYDKQWVETSAQLRMASYTNLDPKLYTFKVKATNKDGVWNQGHRAIDILIKPAWHQTFIARSLFILGGALFIFGLFLAWDQKRKLELQNTVNAQLKEVDRLKDDFLANTSHELRTPLNGIIGIAESLIDGAVGKLPEQARSHLQLILSSGQGLTHLVNDILDFSKLKHKKLRLRLGPVDLRSVGDVVFIHCGPMTIGKDLRISNNIPKYLAPAHADENRLLQIFYNLVGNAIKFTDTGSVTLDAFRQGDRLQIRVTDTGVGIPNDQLETIFQSFEQTRITSKYGGTGLGLTVTRQLVELHGGEIRAESILGQGSTFIFDLPVSSLDTIQRDAANYQPSAPAPLNIIDTPAPKRVEPQNGVIFKILIVDDEPVNRQVLFNHLSMPSYHLADAKNGQDALDMIEEQGPFDLVLLDVMMPGINGYEVCKQIRENYDFHQLPIIFLTAKNQTEDIKDAFNAGGNDYISKPVAKSELLARVTTHLNLLHVNKNLDELVKSQTKELQENHDKILKTSKDLDNKNRELLGLLEIIRTINMDSALDTIKDNLLQHGINLFPSADKALLFTRTGGIFTVAAAVGYQMSDLKDCRLMTQELTDLYRGRSTALHRGVYLNARVGVSASAPVYKPLHPLHSLLAMAINRESKLEGVLILASSQEGREFMASDVGRLERFRQHAVNALSKAWLYEEMEGYRGEVIMGARRAQQLQMALKPPPNVLSNAFPQHFVFQKNAGVASGDLFIATRSENTFYLAMADCGNSGIPDAMTSVMVMYLFRSILNTATEETPGQLIHQLVDSLEQATFGSFGPIRISLSLCRLDLAERQLHFASSQMPLFLVSNPDAGGLSSLEPEPEILNVKNGPTPGVQRDWAPGDMLYLASDGFQDQLNSAGKPFGRSQLETLLRDISKRRMSRQKELLSTALANHRCLTDLTDNMTIIGLELPS